MGRGLGTGLLAAAPLCCLLGCTGSAPQRAAEPPAAALDDSDIERWVGGVPPTTSEQPQAEARAEPPGPIELASGERFEVLLALSRVRPTPAPDAHCSLYALRAGDGGLEEGRAMVACDADLETARVGDIAFEPVEAPRLTHLHAVLSGARPATDAVSARAKRYGEGTEYQITVRVVTSRRTIEGHVPPVEWPPPGAEQEPTLGRKPASLSEVWEAVMFPHRFAPPPA